MHTLGVSRQINDIAFLFSTVNAASRHWAITGRGRCSEAQVLQAQPRRTTANEKWEKRRYTQRGFNVSKGAAAILKVIKRDGLNLLNDSSKYSRPGTETSPDVDFRSCELV